jgi:hypothetical protein
VQAENLIVAALLVVLAFLVGTVMARGSVGHQRRRFWKSYRPDRFGVADLKSDPTDVGEQLKTVMAASFAKKKVLSFPEYRVFKLIEDETARRDSGHRLFAQASLGEILSSPSDAAYRSINSKRADILLVDRGGWPVLVVEYQGRGHYRGTAAARDAIKKEALRKAGVSYLEVSADDKDEQIIARVRQLLGWHAINGDSVAAASQVAIAR